MNNENFILTNGKVIGLLRNSNFLIKCENGQILKANFLITKSKRRFRIVIGDTVRIKISTVDLKNAQIVSNNVKNE